VPFPGFGEIAEQLRRSTVQVRAGWRRQGSGVIVDSSGVIVTNAHLAVSSPIEVQLWDGRRAQCTLFHRDAARDVAVLRVPIPELIAAPLADSDSVRVGEAVVAVGNPLGFVGAMTTGVVHAMGRVPGLGPMKWIQADVRLAPGNSGGSLANTKGQVIGINTMVAGGLGLAVPSNTVSHQLESREGRASLGIVVRPIPVPVSAEARFGMMVLEVTKDSAADQASLMPGDLLIGAEGRAFDSIEDLERILDGPGERVVCVQFYRGNFRNTRTAIVRLRPAVMAAA
jgi:serine protease Do